MADRPQAFSVVISRGPLRVRLGVSAGAVTDVDLLPLDGQPVAVGPEGAGPDAALLLRAAAQMGEYLDGKRKAFELPLRQPGTLFQDGVWRALRAVPHGHTVTYTQLATRAGHPGAARAVGGALNKNRLPILIPCHRVLAADGLGGFSCGQEWKRALLGIEGVLLGLS